MLKDFVAFHKVGYLMMALSQDEAMRAFDAYTVEGIPHAVLIDRKGIVRMVKVGASVENFQALESEIKKLLAQKTPENWRENEMRQKQFLVHQFVFANQ